MERNKGAFNRYWPVLGTGGPAETLGRSCPSHRISLLSTIGCDYSSVYLRHHRKKKGQRPARAWTVVLAGRPGAPSAGRRGTPHQVAVVVGVRPSSSPCSLASRTFCHSGLSPSACCGRLLLEHCTAPTAPSYIAAALIATLVAAALAACC